MSSQRFSSVGLEALRALQSATMKHLHRPQALESRGASPPGIQDLGHQHVNLGRMAPRDPPAPHRKSCESFQRFDSIRGRRGKSSATAKGTRAGVYALARASAAARDIRRCACGRKGLASRSSCLVRPGLPFKSSGGTCQDRRPLHSILIPELG